MTALWAKTKQSHGIIQVGKHLRGPPVQPPAQRKVTHEIIPAFSGLYPAGFLKPPWKETAQPLQAASPTAWLTSQWKMPYRHRPLWLQFTPSVSCPLTMQHCEERGFALLKTSPQVLKGHRQALPSLLQAPQQEQFLCLSSQGKSSHLKTILVALHWTHPSLSTPPLSWGAVQLDAIFWMQSNECWVVGDNHVTWPSGCAPVSTAHTAAPCLACCPVQPPGLSQQSCSPARLSQAVLVQGVTPARKQSQEAPPLNSCLNGKFA